MVDPCCGNSLQTGVKLIAVVSLIWTVILIAIETILLFSNGLAGVGVLNPEFTDQKLLDDNSNSTARLPALKNGTINHKTVFSIPVLDLVMSFAWIVSWIVDICFSVMLFIGARKKSTKLCMIWFYFRTAALVFRVIFLIIYIIAGYSVITKVPVIGLLLFRVYCLWVVSIFVIQIRVEKNEAHAITIPTVVVSYDDKSESKNGEGVENPMYRN